MVSAASAHTLSYLSLSAALLRQLRSPCQYSLQISGSEVVCLNQAGPDIDVLKSPRAQRSLDVVQRRAAIRMRRDMASAQVREQTGGLSQIVIFKYIYNISSCLIRARPICMCVRERERRRENYQECVLMRRWKK